MASQLQSYLDTTEYFAASPNVTTANIASIFMTLVMAFYLEAPPSPIPKDLDDSVYDFIIVGGGTAGCVLASRLSEIPDWNVLLLEAGGEEDEVIDIPAYKAYVQEANSPVMWPIQTQPQLRVCGGGGCPWPVGKILGGTSTVNTMIHARGFKKDYDHWAESGNEGWDWDEVLEYFKKSEDDLDPKYASDTKYHSTGGYLGLQMFPYQDVNIDNIVKAYNELGYQNTDYNGPNPTGIFVMQGALRNGTRQSTNRAFLQPVRNRPNLRVVTGVRVTKLIINTDAEPKVVGVQYMSENDHKITGEVRVKKEVIVSAGALLSPQLLMLSGIGPVETLQLQGIPVIKDAKVGHNLQNHPTSYGVSVYATKTSTIPTTKEQWIEDIKTYINKRNGPLSSTGVSQLSGYWNSEGETEDYPNLKYGFSFSDVITTTTKTPGCYYSKITIGPYLMRPKSRGLVSISSKNITDPPVVWANFLEDPRDMHPLIEGHLFAMKLAKTKAFAESGYVLDDTPVAGCESSPFGTYAYFQCMMQFYIAGAHHYAGTCKMGPVSDPNAVVSNELKVHGVQNLRVVDASIIPEITSSNTNAPVIMIAEKGSDLIKASWDKLPKHQ